MPPPTTPAATLSGMVITTGVKRRISASEARQTWSRSIRSWPCAATSKSSNHLRSRPDARIYPHGNSRVRVPRRVGKQDLRDRGGRPKIPVTTKEVLDFYPAEHRLKETDIEQYAAAYTARIKAYREYTRQLDATLVRRLLDKERLMKVGESDGFRLKLHFDWFVILKRENERMYAPFKYAVNAYCLDNIQTFDRRYVTLEDALLHCPNGFNENANIPNRYKSIGHYLSGEISTTGSVSTGYRRPRVLSLDRNTVGTSNNVTKE
ncbi:hypothetical protein NIB75_19585 [Bacteroides uniformis]|nr:hypothetical protein [Bacteroides uniformis]